jgi:two-component system sensor histidine kinase YesM
MKKWTADMLLVFKNLSMQKKMIYAFSIPVIIICIMINLVCYHIISRNYEERLRYSVNQSCEQAGAFVLNYIENMYYTSALISNNNKVEDVLSSSEFGAERELDEQYREFWKLNDIFQAIALSNPSFRIG